MVLFSKSSCPWFHSACADSDLQVSRYLNRSPNKEASLLDVWYLTKMGAVRCCGIFMSFFYVIVSTSGSSDVFDGVLGNTASCHKTCQMTYSLHTYPRVSASFTDKPKHCLRQCKRVNAVELFYLLSVCNVFVRHYTLQRVNKVNWKCKHAKCKCLFWPVCFGRKRLCTPVREDVVSFPFVSLSVTARISTIPNRNASRVILVLKSFSLKIYYNCYCYIIPCVSLTSRSVSRGLRSVRRTVCVQSWVSESTPICRAKNGRGIVKEA